MFFRVRLFVWLFQHETFNMRCMKFGRRKVRLRMIIFPKQYTLCNRVRKELQSINLLENLRAFGTYQPLIFVDRFEKTSILIEIS